MSEAGVTLSAVPETLSLAAARRTALAAQGFGSAHPERVSPASLHAVMRRVGVLQIDSVNVFSRSHYMPFFSRLGVYDIAALDRLAFGSHASYTEYWAHVATVIPTADWGLWRFRMDEYAPRVSARDPWAQANQQTLDWVRAELAQRGPSRPAEIEQDAATGPRGPWWDWSATKRALERLFLAGEVAIAGRRGFERRYALASDVIPAEVLAAPVPREDAIRELTARGLAFHGVATAADIADYHRLGRAEVLVALRDLEDAGVALPVRVQGWERNGRPIPAWIHRDARVPRRMSAAALLTPFDPVVWFRDRTERLFGVEYRIEIYTPEPRRRYGYYSLPVLIDDQLVARVDLKADRARSELLVQSAWWDGEPRPAEVERIADELRRAATWKGLERISVGRWGDAADAVADALAVHPQHRGRHDRASR